ncbi:hypothetical protein RRG08_011449 [Elysia crispata]|uniref:Major facilitator superfamily (MFS) profile domain-containing protein n=1 Tax=Elysia crispata TaxID=231223 RepID=A0AAE0ZV01_9GAST|nr:hypothetical protein RRG08_011449 [Elysia crispata]
MTMTETSENLEHLISLLGGRGKFQTSVHILAAVGCYLSITFNHLVMAFHGSPVSHTCMAGVNQSDLVNATPKTEFNLTNVQQHVTNITHSKCFTTVSYSDGHDDVIDCTSGQWEYFPKYGERNIVSEFDLVCSAEYLNSLATTIYFTGVMVGGLVFGDLADRFGRLPVMLITLYASVMFGLISAFSVNYVMFVVLRFIVGIFTQGVQMATYTLIIEMYPPKYRPYAGVGTDLVFSMAVIVLSGLAYLMPHWRHLQIAISVLPLATVFYAWYLPESLRWLVIKGNTERAEKLLRRICNINKLRFPAETWNLLEKDTAIQEETTQQYNVTHLFHTWSLTKATVICSYLCVVMAVTYYGVTFKTSSLPGSIYMNFFISGVMEVIVCLITIYLLNRFGRKKPMFGCLVSAGVLCLACGVIGQYTSGLGHLITALALAGKCFSGAIFVTFFVYATELYPTVIRNIGLGFGLVWARLGGVLAPQFNQWSKALLGFDAIYVFGVLSLVGGFAILLLPETHRRRLPDVIEQDIQVDKSGMDVEDVEDVEYGEDAVREDLL